MQTQHTPGPWRYVRENGSPTTGQHMINGAPHQPAPVVDDADATEILALSLDEFGYHTEARNVRAGEDLDEYRTEMWAIRAALARAQGVGNG